ncbi:hypothetical protein [Ahrensia sp. R2A130]|uniref:hypothetical protein n=1 Tax=Ahrensia sp. R2A130 TaxID=744979 RepID=UPI0001E09CBF|nr:hypothetical protein [Ahrensia sp. R2A130]EFL88215.1 dihydropyrimidinase 2 [Ahrensia sp. R2A130]
MILTPTNRYGLSQALTLAVWPKLTPLLLGPLRKLRGVRVATLCKAIATRTLSSDAGIHRLRWDDFRNMQASSAVAPTGIDT